VLTRDPRSPGPEREPADPAFRLVVESHPTAILVVDSAGRIVYANAEVVAMLGYDVDEMRAMSVDDLVPASLAGRHAVHRATYGRHPVARRMGESLELHARRKDGSLVPVDVALRSYHHDGETYTVAAVVDTTAQRAEQALRQRFLDVLSHELRTPVTTLYAAALLLHERRGTLPSTAVDELTEGMAAEADRLQRMVENLLVVARVERGVAIEAEEPILLHRLLPEVAVRERRFTPELELVLDIAHPLPMVRGHEESIALIIRNLLSNAIKYGGGTPVRIEVRRAGRLVEVRVEDGGPGLDPGDAGHLFDIYFRSAATERTAAGSGIGLFVARRLAEAMGGSLRADTGDRGGARFILALVPFDA
jgi:PAS domain S-box-containing protein